MRKKKYNLFTLTDVFGVSYNKDVLQLIKQGCKEVLNISEVDFDSKFCKVTLPKKVKSNAHIGGNYRSSGGDGNSGRSYQTPLILLLFSGTYLTGAQV